MALIEKLKRLFGRKEIPLEARDLLKKASTPKELLQGLDELITRNELEVHDINRQIEKLEEIEVQEKEQVRSGQLPTRTKNNVLRSIQRRRKQMDNLEERQQIYNRNINLQIDLVGRIQALDAMELRGVDEDQIDDILGDYEEELSRYQSVIDAQDIAVGDISGMLDDSAELSDLESEILGSEPATPEPAPRASDPLDDEAVEEIAKGPTRAEREAPTRIEPVRERTAPPPPPEESRASKESDS